MLFPVVVIQPPLLYSLYTVRQTLAISSNISIQLLFERPNLEQVVQQEELPSNYQCITTPPVCLLVQLLNRRNVAIVKNRPSTTTNVEEKSSSY